MPKHSTSYNRFHLILPLLFLFGLLSGCGFQLRGTDGSYALDQLSPLYVSGVGAGDPLYTMLRGQLTGSGVKLVDNPNQAKEQLHIYNRSQEKKTHSVTGRGKVREYELIESLSFNLGGTPDSMEREQNKPISVRRVYVNPETEVMARQTEEGDLRRDMQQQLVGMLLQRMAAQTRNRSRVAKDQ